MLNMTMMMTAETVKEAPPTHLYLGGQTRLELFSGEQALTFFVIDFRLTEVICSGVTGGKKDDSKKTRTYEDVFIRALEDELMARASW